MSENGWTEFHKAYLNYIDWDKFNEFDILKAFIESTFLNNPQVGEFINSISDKNTKKTLIDFFGEVDRAAYAHEQNFKHLKESYLKIKKADKRTAKERAKEAGLVVLEPSTKATKGGIILD